MHSSRIFLHIPVSTPVLESAHMDYHIFAMNNEDKFSQSTVGMNTLYDSEAFAVVHMQPTPELDADEAIRMDGRAHLALARHGFEIVDKRCGKHVYLDGSWAELFQQQITRWQEETPTQEEVEDMLDHYSGLAGSPVMLH